MLSKLILKFNMFNSVVAERARFNYCMLVGVGGGGGEGVGDDVIDGKLS